MSLHPGGGGRRERLYENMLLSSILSGKGGGFRLVWEGELKGDGKWELILLSIQDWS